MTFDRDWVLAPGAILQDWMEENHLSVRVTAKTCAMTPEEMQRLLDGKVRVTHVRAAKLAAGTGIPARIWVRLERSYRDGLAAGKIDATHT